MRNTKEKKMLDKSKTNTRQTKLQRKLEIKNKSKSENMKMVKLNKHV